MREYKNKEAKILDRIICNGCGKVITVRRGMPMEGVFSVHQVWEYMSGKDGEIVAMYSFGASAPAGQLFEKFGFTADNVADKAKSSMAKAR